MTSGSGTRHMGSGSGRPPQRPRDGSGEEEQENLKRGGGGGVNRPKRRSEGLAKLWALK